MHNINEEFAVSMKNHLSVFKNCFCVIQFEIWECVQEFMQRKNSYFVAEEIVVVMLGRLGEAGFYGLLNC